MTTTTSERHYDDEALIGLLESDRAASDEHLPACAACSEKAESFRMIAGALRDGALWDKRELDAEPVASTIASLRAFAAGMADEDARADRYAEALLAGPRESWRPKLDHHPEYRMAGMVRKLLAAADRALDTMPPDAVEITAIATDIADHLDPSAYPSDTVPRLRGAAWRDRAYALYYTGAFAAAEKAVFASQSHFSDCSVSEYDQARLGIVEALVLRGVDRFAESEAAAERAARTLRPYADLQRYASAQIARVHVLLSTGDFETGRRVLVDLERSLRDSPCVDTHARVLVNLGSCSRKLGLTDEAIQYFEIGAALFDALGVTTEALRIRWNSALIMAEAGLLTDAEERLVSISREFDALGMTSEAAVAGLDLADLLLATARFAEVESICRTAIQSFQRSGVSYSARALTALAYMREAAAQSKASRSLLREVRDYIRRLPTQPNLLFAPSPAWWDPRVDGSG